MSHALRAPALGQLMSNLEIAAQELRFAIGVTALISHMREDASLASPEHHLVFTSLRRFIIRKSDSAFSQKARPLLVEFSELIQQSAPAEKGLIRGSELGLSPCTVAVTLQPPKSKPLRLAVVVFGAQGSENEAVTLKALLGLRELGWEGPYKLIAAVPT